VQIRTAARRSNGEYRVDSRDFKGADSCGPLTSATGSLPNLHPWIRYSRYAQRDGMR